MEQQIYNSIEAADIVVIIAAIIAAIVSMITVIITVIAERKTNNKMTNFQREWNQIQLDADLKSKARIEWIQKVRDTTSELIALYFKVLNEKDKDKLFDSYTVARQKSELLILYFGPEDNESNHEIEKEMLLCTIVK